MKAKYVAALTVAVFFRTAAVCIALFGVFVALAPMLLGGVGPSLILLRLLVVYVAVALVLWLLSRPLASFVVKGLEDEPRT